VAVFLAPRFNRAKIATAKMGYHLSAFTHEHLDVGSDLRQHSLCLVIIHFQETIRENVLHFFYTGHQSLQRVDIMNGQFHFISRETLEPLFHHGCQHTHRR
jgi:hypothetical protein